MKRLFLISFIIVLVAGLVFGGCAKPAPAPAPAPTPAPAPAPTPAPTPAPKPAPTPAPAPAPAPPPPVKVTKLVASNPFPPVGNASSITLEEWAKEFEAKTGGRYTVEVVHGGALASLPDSYDVVLSGIVDIANWVFQDTPKDNHMIEVVSLPHGYASLETMTPSLLNNVYKKGYLDKELADVKMLYFHVGGPVDDFLTKKPINSVADINGLKMVTGGGPFKADFVKSLGGVPVFGGPPDAYLMTQKGVTDGIFISGIGLKEFHWAELVKYDANPLRMNSVCFGVGMNLNTFNKMPDDVKAIIDDMNADGKFSMRASELYDGMYNDSTKWFFETQGGQMIDWNPAALAELEKYVAPLWTAWIDEQTAMGYPAKEVVDAFYGGIRKSGFNIPTLGYTVGE